jgi:CRISPR-associated protein Cmr6
MGGRAGQRGPGGPRPPDHRRGGASRQGPHDDGLSYPLPERTRAAWQAHQRRSPQNPSLLFDRFAPDWHDDAKRKERGLRDIAAVAKQTDAKLLDGWNVRWKQTALAVNAETFTLTTDWRLITGLGRTGPLEVGFTFHRYGFPFLPGSSLKGLARTAGLLAVAAALGEDGLAALRDHRRAQARDGELSELAALAQVLELDDVKAFNAAWAAAGETPSEVWALAEDFRAIFGTTGTAGQAVFLDAIPTQRPTLDLDIMNPHFPDYYRDGSGGTAPADWQNPNPVFFLTVAAGTTFRFAVGWRGPRDSDGQWIRRRDQAVTWLQDGLVESGAGAKTGAGYGYFLSPPPPQITARTVATTGARPAETVAANPEIAAPPPAAEEMREGTIAEYNAAAGRGRIRDDLTGDQWPFTRDAIPDKSWTPGRRRPVRYAIQVRDGESVVVRVERREES